MIRHVSFRNFKCLHHVGIALEPLTFIVGQNGSGKTSILEGIEFVSKLIPRIAVVDNASNFSLNELYSLGGEGPMEITVDQDVGKLRLVLSNDGSVSSWDRVGGTSWGYKLSPGTNAAEYNECLKGISSVSYVQLSAKALSQPSYSDQVVPELEVDGTGLPSVLQYMALTNRIQFEEVQKQLRLIVPTFESIGFVRSPIETSKKEMVSFGADQVERTLKNTVMGESLTLSFHGAKNVPATRASEGTILALGVLTMLQSPVRSRTLLLDDVEHGLHPMAQVALVEVIRTIMNQNPDMQIVASSHSPYILDSLKPEEVRITTIGSDGHTNIGSLTEHQDFHRWTNEMTPGELWSVFGEKWILDRAK